MNPFYTPYEYTPFDTIKETDYEPAILKGIEEEDKEIDQIVNQPEAPTFENTIEALDRTGELLGKVTSVFYNQLSAETSDYLDELSQRMSPILTEHSNNITLNKKDGIADNEQLAFARALGVKNYIENKIQGFASMQNDFQYYIEVAKETGSQFRRISVIYTFIDAF